MPKEYINREWLIMQINSKQRTWNNCAAVKALEELKNMPFPAADVVEVETIKAWLYKIAMNNVGVSFDGDFSNACEEIISRLDGLKKFAKDMDGERRE